MWATPVSLGLFSTTGITGVERCTLILTGATIIDNPKSRLLHCALLAAVKERRSLAAYVVEAGGQAGWLVGWSVGWLVGWLVGRSVDWLVGWLIGRLIGWLIAGLVGWFVRSLAPWLVRSFVVLIYSA